MLPSKQLPASASAHGLPCQAWIPLSGRQSCRLRCDPSYRCRCRSDRFVAWATATKRSLKGQRQGHRHKLGAHSRQNDSNSDTNAAEAASATAPVALVLGIASVLGAGFIFKSEIREFIDTFVHTVDGYGPIGYVYYGVLYVVLEILAVPAIPLTMTAGVIFGVLPGTIVVSAASTAAATIAFLIARYAARDKVRELAEGRPQFKSVDRAIGKNSFKVVTLLRLSPLLPLALSNYFYGLTSVDLPSYVAASWLGMLPGTIAYVTAGSYGRTVLDNGEGELPLEWWQVALGAGITVLALGYLGKLGKSAIDEAEQETV